jgi:hypothetical protein
MILKGDEPPMIKNTFAIGPEEEDEGGIPVNRKTEKRELREVEAN